jgi:hypothetical protein
VKQNRENVIFYFRVNAKFRFLRKFSDLQSFLRKHFFQKSKFFKAAVRFWHVLGIFSQKLEGFSENKYLHKNLDENKYFRENLSNSHTIKIFYKNGPFLFPLFCLFCSKLKECQSLVIFAKMSHKIFAKIFAIYGSNFRENAIVFP